jgi:isoquinoline 1-oxidoreductase beta subunit
MSTTRRAFLKTASLAGAVLAVGVRLEGAPPAGVAFQPSIWLRMTADGRVTVTVGKSEMGQGVRTALPMIVAEELGVAWSQVDLTQAEPGARFPRLGTGGSYSIQSLWGPLRQAAAAAREMLVTAAAAQWGVPAGSCKAVQGAVLHEATGRRLAFGKLVADAAKLAVPAAPALKAAEAFTLVGHSTLRYDGPRLLDGAAQFGLDVKLPGMRYAVVARCPVFGGKAATWDAAKAKARPGVTDVVALSTGIAVVARSTYQALEAVSALAVTWDPGPHPTFSTESNRALLQELLLKPGVPARAEGDAAQALKGAGRRLEAQYEFPWQAHLTLEAPNCVAHVKADSCELWTGSQSPNDAQARVAKLLGLPLEAVRVHVTLLGGGFGRRLRSDFATEAAELSRAIQAPVQIVWTRQDDIQHDHYHPMSLHRMEAGLDGGSLSAWLHRVAAPSIALSWSEGKRSPGLIHAEANGAEDMPYRAPNLSVEYAESPCHVSLGWWRGIEAVPNVFARECFLDEVATALGQDPLALRLALLGAARVAALGEEKVDLGRLAAVLSLAAAKGDWGKPLPKGHGRGIACCAYEGRSYVAQVAEVSIDAAGALKVHRVVAAADCGLVVNPTGAIGQVESGIIWGLSALHTQVTFKDGRVEQSAYSEFPVVRMADAPRIEVHLVPSRETPTGLSEPPVPPTIPAVLNAVFAATGQRVRRLPWAPSKS